MAYVVFSLTKLNSTYGYFKPKLVVDVMKSLINFSNQTPEPDDITEQVGSSSII